jgi:N utilization substance protein A
MSAEVLHIIDQLSREKGIERSILVEAMQTAMEAAARKNLPHLENIVSKFNEETGQVEIFIEKQVVKKVEDDSTEVTLKEAKKANPGAAIDDTVLVRHNVDNLGRIAAQLAKQVILQKVREAEIDIIYNDYNNRKGELINGFVHRFEHGDMIIDL